MGTTDLKSHQALVEPEVAVVEPEIVVVKFRVSPNLIMTLWQKFFARLDKKS